MKSLRIALTAGMMLVALPVFAQVAPTGEDLEIEYGAKMFDWTREHDPEGDDIQQQQAGVAYKKEIKACRRAVENLAQVLDQRSAFIRESAIDYHDYGWIKYPAPEAYYRDMVETYSDFLIALRKLTYREGLKREECYDFIQKWDRERFHCLFDNTMNNRSGKNPECVPEVYARFFLPGGGLSINNEKWKVK